MSTKLRFYRNLGIDLFALVVDSLPYKKFLPNLTSSLLFVERVFLHVARQLFRVTAFFRFVPQFNLVMLRV